MALLPKMNSSTSQRVNIPYLSGGINPGSVGEAVSDNQLTDCNNVWFRGGEIVTRPKFQNVNTDIKKEIDFKTTKTAEKYIDGKKFKFYLHNTELKITVIIINDDASVFKTLEYSAEKIENAIIYCANKTQDNSLGVYVVFKEDGNGKFGEVCYDNETKKYSLEVKSLMNNAYIPQVRINGYGNLFHYLPRTDDAKTEKTTMLEGFNLLNGSYKASYTTDGISRMFYLPEKLKSTDKVVVEISNASQMFCGNALAFYCHESQSNIISEAQIAPSFYKYENVVTANGEVKEKVNGSTDKLIFTFDENNDLSNEKYIADGTMPSYWGDFQTKYLVTYYRTLFQGKINRDTGCIYFICKKRKDNYVYEYDKNGGSSIDDLGITIKNAYPTNYVKGVLHIGDKTQNIEFDTSDGSIVWVQNFDFNAKSRESNDYISFQGTSLENKSFMPYFRLNRDENAYMVFGAGSQNNMMVTVYDNTAGEIDKILNSTLTTNYSGNIGLNNGVRTMLGNGNKVYFSDISQPLYFPENCYFSVGDSTPITAFGQQQGYLVIAKENSLYYTYETALDSDTSSENTSTALQTQNIIDLTARYKYSLFSLSSEVGCDLPETMCLCMNRLIWANTDGNVYTLAGLSQFSERNVFVVSGLIKNQLKKTPLNGALAVDWQGYYLLIIGNKAFCLDYNRNAFKYIGSYTSDSNVRKYGLFSWWIWTLPEKISGAVSTDDCLSLLSSNNNVIKNYKMDIDEPEDETESMIQSKFFDFSFPDFYKAIDRLQIDVGNDHDNTIFVELLTDGGTIQKIPIEISATGKRGTASYQREKVIYPLIKNCRKFGFRITATGAFSLGSANMNYTLKGSVLNGKN